MKYPEIFQFANTLSPISEKEWPKFESNFEEVSYKKNEIFCKPGEQADSIYFLISGVARNYFLSPTGKEFTKSLRGPRGLVGPYSEILSGLPTKYFIQATTDLKAVKFSFAHFRSLMDVSKEWERLGRIIAEQNYLEKEHREYVLIHMSIPEKYNDFLKEFENFKDHIPQYQIASYLGVTPEALNRHLSKR